MTKLFLFIALLVAISSVVQGALYTVLVIQNDLLAYPEVPWGGAYLATLNPKDGNTSIIAQYNFEVGGYSLRDTVGTFARDVAYFATAGALMGYNMTSRSLTLTQKVSSGFNTLVYDRKSDLLIVPSFRDDGTSIFSFSLSNPSTWSQQWLNSKHRMYWSGSFAEAGTLYFLQRSQTPEYFTITSAPIKNLRNPITRANFTGSCDMPNGLARDARNPSNYLSIGIDWDVGLKPKYYLQSISLNGTCSQRPLAVTNFRNNGWYYDESAHLIYLSTSDVGYFGTIVYTINVATASIIHSVKLENAVAFNLFNGP